MEYTKDRNNWYICDFETTTEHSNYFKEHNDVRVILAGSLNFEKDTYYLNTNIESWWEYHLNLNVSQTIWFHNIKFDGDYIVKYFVKNGYHISNNEKLKHKEFSIFRDGGKIYKIELFIRKRVQDKVKDLRFIFRCSLLLLSASIASLGKSFGIKKKLDNEDSTFYNKEPNDDINYWLNNEKRFCEYLYNDCLIGKLALKNFEKNIDNIDFVKDYNFKRVLRDKSTFNVFNCLTAGAVAKKLAKYSTKLINQMEHTNIDYLTISKEQSDILNNYFSGGYVEFNTKYNCKYKKVKNAIMVDIKSAYPYQMTQDLPYGEFYFIEPKEPYYKFCEIDVAFAKIKKKCENVPILKNWKKESNLRYVKELKNFKCFYLKEEWEMITKFYDIKINTIKSFYMLKKPFLKPIITQLYDIKEKYDKLKDDAQKMGAKILLNSLYGKMCENSEHDNVVYFKNSENINEFSEIEIDNKHYKFLRANPTYNIDIYNCYTFAPIDTKEIVSNRAAAVVITALQRIYLWNKIYEIGCEYFGLSDTDSILFVNLTNEKLEQLNKSLGHKLGDFEKENKDDIQYFGTYGAKKYVLLNQEEKIVKFRFAGIQVDMNNVKDFLDKYNWDEDVLNIDEATLKVVYCDSGILLKQIPKSMKRGDI